MHDEFDRRKSRTGADRRTCCPCLPGQGFLTGTWAPGKSDTPPTTMSAKKASGQMLTWYRSRSPRNAGCDRNIWRLRRKTNPRIEKNTFTGTFTERRTTDVDTTPGTFSVTLAAKNQSFMGAMYKSGGYGPENGFAPSWWAKKIP